MKNIYLVITIVLLSSPVFSQANNAAFNINTRKMHVDKNRAAFGLSEDEFNNIKGSPYAHENFLPGNIYLDGKIIKKDILLRYNIFSDEIEIKESENAAEDSYGALIRKPSIFIHVLNDIFVFVPFQGSNEKGHYFNVISEGNNLDLYKKIEVTYRPPYTAKTSYERAKPAEFIQSNTYYLATKERDFYELPSSKSKIIKTMSKKQKEIKLYIKKNRLDVKKEKDLKRLVAYYDSLL